MPDLGIFSVPLLAAFSVFLVAFFTGDEIRIDNVPTPADMQWNGFDSTVVTKLLLDELRQINEDAQSEAAGVAIDPSYVDQSLGQYASYFGIEKLVDTTRNAVGANTYYVSSEIIDNDGKIVYIARLFRPDRLNEPYEPVDVVRVEGDPAKPLPMLREAALQLLTDISPYIMALHYFKLESAAKQWDYPKTVALLKQHIETPPPKNNYLALELMGRMHQRRANFDTTLTPQQRHQELLDAKADLNAALRQNPDFLYANVTLGAVCTDLEDYASADRFFTAAVGLDPNYLPARQRWAKSLVKQGRLREAIFQYVAAVEIAPHDAELRDTLAELYFELNYPDAALAQWQIAMTLDPTSGHIMDHLKSFVRHGGPK